MKKPQRLLESKNLTGLDGVKDVSFGPAPPERRRQGDYSKEGVPTVAADSFDDHNERMERYTRGLSWLP